jgi:hypothetical protein
MFLVRDVKPENFIRLIEDQRPPGMAAKHNPQIIKYRTAD